MLPATTCVKLPTAMSQVMMVMTGSLALSAEGSIHTIAAMRKPDEMPRNSMCQASIAAISRLIASMPSNSSGGTTGTNVQIGQLQLSTFINPTGLQSAGENLYVETDASGPANFAQPGLDGAGLVLQNYVETSNVNVAEELVNMITTQRAYEMNSKAISTSDQMLARLTQL